MEQGAETLLYIVGILAIAGVLVVLTMQLTGIIDIADIGAIKETINYPNQLDGMTFGQQDYTDLDNDLNNTTATEVSCAIAKALRDDYLEYGDTTSRPKTTGDYWNLEYDKSKTIVKSGVFNIRWNHDTKNFLQFADLPASEQKALMEDGGCSDLMTAPAASGENVVSKDHVAYWGCPTPYLDDECITLALGHLSANPGTEDKRINLCTKNGEHVQIFAGGPQKDFGNEDCTGLGGNVLWPSQKYVPGKMTVNLPGSGTADGSDNCKDYCKGAKQMINEWYAPGGNGSTDYVDDTDIIISGSEKKALGLPIYKSYRSLTQSDAIQVALTAAQLYPVNPWPPSQCIDNDGKQLCNPIYRWFLVWDSKDKKYSVQVLRIPNTTSLMRTDHISLVNTLLLNAPITRDMEVAYPYQETRMRWDMLYQPTDTVSIASIASTMSDALKTYVVKDPSGMLTFFGSDKWTVVLADTCTGDMCYDVAIPPPVHYREVKRPGTCSGGTCTATQADGATTGAKLHTVNLITNIKDPYAGLQKDHQYRVIMHFWETTKTGDWATPGGGGVPCLEKNGDDVQIRNAISDPCVHHGDPYTQYKDVWHYQDYTLIIVDLGVNGQGEGVGS